MHLTVATAQLIPSRAEQVAMRLVFYPSLACLLFLTMRVEQTAQERILLVLLLVALCGVGLVNNVRWRRVNARIAEQLSFNAQLIDAVPEPLSMRSPDGRFMLVNRAFERRVGISRDRLLGQRVDEALAPEVAERILMMDARAAAALEAQEGTFHVPTPEGMRHVHVVVEGLRREDGSLIGTIGIQNDVTELVEKEEQLVDSNARLSQLSMKMIGAQEAERRRIARDLHDQVGQILTALKLQLSSLARRDQLSSPAVAFSAPIDLTEEALAHTRNLSASLHPHLLDDLGLESALGWLIDRFIRPSLPNVDLRCRLDPPRGPQPTELVAFRVVQEALTNVVRHAHASRAGVMLESCVGELTIEVIDDGVGFEAAHAATSVGLAGMRDRVAEMGGELQVHSTRGGGTSLRVRLAWPPSGGGRKS
ncbi:hypothetical protein GCM10027034_18860 [Ramlibacter solisilvae]|uniref:PAS domain-containing sensor histidine kinase n=1 Tax=Ramlibacter tataouinensis TaxID=94132 RepID=UPI000776B29D|nr:PAS domain-containing sensor histidine kinase [Ramlibacter tataouinensis]